MAIIVIPISKATAMRLASHSSIKVRATITQVRKLPALMMEDKAGILIKKPLSLRRFIAAPHSLAQAAVYDAAKPPVRVRSLLMELDVVQQIIQTLTRVTEETHVIEHILITVTIVMEPMCLKRHSARISLPIN